MGCARRCRTGDGLAGLRVAWDDFTGYRPDRTAEDGRRVSAVLACRVVVRVGHISAAHAPLRVSTCPPVTKRHRSVPPSAMSESGSGRAADMSAEHHRAEQRGVADGRDCSSQWRPPTSGHRAAVAGRIRSYGSRLGVVRRQPRSAGRPAGPGLGAVRAGAPAHRGGDAADGAKPFGGACGAAVLAAARRRARRGRPVARGGRRAQRCRPADTVRLRHQFGAHGRLDRPALWALYRLPLGSRSRGELVRLGLDIVPSPCRPCCFFGTS